MYSPAPSEDVVNQGRLLQWVSASAWLAVLAVSALSLGCQTEENRKLRLDAAPNASGELDAALADAPLVADATSCADDAACPGSDNPCVVATCFEGQCRLENRAEGTACDDGLACTVQDSCRGGVCGGSAKLCDDGLACSVDACEESMGGCVSDVTACACETQADCDDGNACNGVESCDAVKRTCVRGAAIDCSALNNDCNVGQCNPATGACTAAPRADDTACNDGKLCTKADVCKAGICGGTAITCTAKDACHEPGVCVPETGLCTDPIKANGAACDDGSLCTRGDVCTEGVCTPGAAVTCVATGECRGPGVCVPETGICTQPPLANGTICNDGSQCTVSDVCNNGVCNGTPRVCDDGRSCSVDSCSEATGCVADVSTCGCQNDGQCNDGNACNGVETCNLTTGACVAGLPKDCGALSNACNVGTCNAQTGACVASPRPNGTACSDGNACTQTDSCQSGTCQGSNPVTCSASDQCHVAGVCNPQTGMCSNPAKSNGSACNDGNACTQSDTCQSGSCAGGNPVVCAAISQCHTAGVCNPQSGACTNPTKANGSTCNDGNACTRTDSCQSGICGGGNPVVCTAQSQCHVAGVCNASTGVCSNPSKADGAACNDGNACTKTDVCMAGSCAGGNPVVCSAKDQCHLAGTCNTSTGVCADPPKPNGSACDDSNACTRADACQAGVCTGADPVVCRAKDVCHVAGACNPANGVCSDPVGNEGGACNDGKACTTNDRCTAGVCAGGAVVCNDGISCTADACVEAQGGCVFDKAKCDCTGDADCADSNLCNGRETCNLQTLTCQAGMAVDCSGLNDACNTGSCVPATGACVSSPRPDGTACNDQNACTRTDVCSGGRCAGGNPVVCATPNQCQTTGTCNPATGSCSLPNKPDGTACVDNSACTTGDRCTNGVCQGSPRLCNSPPTCQTGGMCADNGVCVYQPVVDGSACDDGKACTLSDSCQRGGCAGVSRSNKAGDWNQTPAVGKNQIVSVDIDNYEKGMVLAGVFTGAVNFGGLTLTVPQEFSAGAYCVAYDTNGAVIGGKLLIGATFGRSGVFEVNDVAVHKDGGFVIVGGMMGTITFDGLKGPIVTESPEAFVAAYDANRNLRWLRRGTGGRSSAVAIDAYDDQRVMVGGYLEKQVLLQSLDGAKAIEGNGTYAAVYSSAGELLYAAEVATQKLGALKVASDNSSRVSAFQGTFSGQVAVGPERAWVLPGFGGNDVALFGFDSEGKASWAMQIAAKADDVSGGVTAAAGAFASFISTSGSEAFVQSQSFGQVALHGLPHSALQAHLVTVKANGTLMDASLLANAQGQPVRAWDVVADEASRKLTILGSLVREAQIFGAIGFGSGAPAKPERTLISAADGASLFAGRFGLEVPQSHWAVDLRGANAGVGSGGSDALIVVHPPQSATATGMFFSTASFGDQVVTTLAPGPGSFFLSHFNSQAEYDYCQ